MSRLARTFATIVHLLSRGLAMLSIVGMVFVMLIVVYNVTLRELDLQPVRGIVEYAELGMAITAFLAIGEAERRRQHVSVDSLLLKLNGRAFQIVRISGGLAGAFVAVLLAWASWEALSDSLARGEFKLGLVRLPMWPARLAVFAGFLVLALEQIVTAVEDAIHRPTPEQVIEAHTL